MRRKDREVTGKKKIEKIIQNCRVVRLAFQDQEAPYIVPVNFGYEWLDDGLTLYVHCAGEGKKLELMKTCPKVGLEMDCGHQLVGEGKACAYGFLFQSVIGWGIAEILENPEDKRHGLERLMLQQTSRQFSISEQDTHAVTVFRVRVQSISAKARNEF